MLVWIYTGNLVLPADEDEIGVEPGDRKGKEQDEVGEEADRESKGKQDPKKEESREREAVGVGHPPLEKLYEMADGFMLDGMKRSIERHCIETCLSIIESFSGLKEGHVTITDVYIGKEGRRLKRRDIQRIGAVLDVLPSIGGYAGAVEEDSLRVIIKNHLVTLFTMPGISSQLLNEAHTIRRRLQSEHNGGLIMDLLVATDHKYGQAVAEINLLGLVLRNLISTLTNSSVFDTYKGDLVRGYIDGHNTGSMLRESLTAGAQWLVQELKRKCLERAAGGMSPDSNFG
ncbi:MAG: hypothetical protein Q9160_005873 [Pyrenula sp. 1 TL-2023]